MKLLYATSIIMPSVRANRLQIMSMAEAFSLKLGKDFVLGIGSSSDEPSDVPVVEVGEHRSFVLAWRYLRLAREHRTTDLYCREERLLFFMLLYNYFLRAPLRFWYEIHHLPYLKTWWHRFILRHITGIVSITEAMKKEVQEVYPGPILTAPDAVSIELFDIPLSKEEARHNVGLPLDKKIVVYAGSIREPWKGVGILYEAAREFDDTYCFIIVGGKPHYVDEFKNSYGSRSNVRMVGHVPHANVPVYLKAADVLVIPNSAKAEISRISTSPMKLFEYMAAGRPIVATDLPSLREVLNEHNAFLVKPDDVEALAKGIRRAVEGDEESASRVTTARIDVEKYTWDKRAKYILAWMADTV